MRAIRYSFDEAMLSLWRGRRSGALSTATIALALFVLGAFLVATSNLERLGLEWNNSAEMSIYLSDNATAAQRAAIERTLAGANSVASQRFLSKADALARFKTTFKDLSATLDGLGDNPLPASYEVRLRGGADVGVDLLLAELRQMPGVADVRYDHEWLQRLSRVVTMVRSVGLALGLLLTIGAALTVANVVRLGLYARRDELDIMQLVGAPQVYINGPFVVEGTLQGGLGALLALAALGGAFIAMKGRYLTPLASAINLSQVTFLSLELSLLLVAGGMLVGCVGGLIAAMGRS
ncbi:MAG TPA: ABC transporter permease [Vicinamibacterales bacterium]|nr:ABC transporter permease [Vicinamibacterales bacterium]